MAIFNIFGTIKLFNLFSTIIELECQTITLHYKAFNKPSSNTTFSVSIHFSTTFTQLFSLTKYKNQTIKRKRR